MAEKSRALALRLSPVDRKLISRAAAADDLPRATWMRRVLIRAAKRLLGEIAEEASNGKS